MREAGYEVDGVPEEGDALIHALIGAGGHDLEFLTEDQLRGAAGRLDAGRYAAWFSRLPEELRAGVEEHWGPPPGELYVDGGEIVVAGLSFGNVFVGIQPPRGFGENPIADLPRPRPPADAPLPGRVLVDHRGLRRRRDRPPRQARDPGVAPRQVPRSLVFVRAGRRPARRAALLPVRRERPRRGDAGQAAGARDHRGPPHPADDPGRDLRRPGPPGAAPRRVLPGRDARPVQAAGHTRPGSGRPCATRSCTGTSASRSSPRSSATS